MDNKTKNVLLKGLLIIPFIFFTLYFFNEAYELVPKITDEIIQQILNLPTHPQKYSFQEISSALANELTPESAADLLTLYKGFFKILFLSVISTILIVIVLRMKFFTITNEAK